MVSRFGSQRSGLFYPITRYVRSSMRLLVFLMSACISSSAPAKYVDIPVGEMVKRTDIGVIARLTNVHKTAGWGLVYATGLLQVDEVLYGDVDATNPIPIKWTVAEGVIPDGDWSRFNTSMIWLTSLKDGVAEDTWAQGILDVSKKAEVLAAMQEPLRVKPNQDPARPWTMANLIIRNLTTSTMEVPAINAQNGQVILPAGTGFSAGFYERGRGDVKLTTASGTVKYAKAPQMVKLVPGQSLEVPVDLAVLYPEGKRQEYFNFQWSLPGLGTSNMSGFYPLTEPDHSHVTDMTPLWYKVLILLRYSPTREIVIGLVVGVIALVVFFWSRRAAQVGLQG